MSKKKDSKVEVTVTVLGNQLTKTEALELYNELGKALNKPDPEPTVIWRDRYPSPWVQPLIGTTAPTPQFTSNETITNLQEVSNGH